MPLTSILNAAGLVGTEWSVEIRMPRTEVRLRHRADALLRTASVGKLFLLWELAERIAAGALRPDALVRRDSVEPVRDSGIWQHLDTGTITVADAALLVGAASDNLATNVLLEHIGLEPVQARARAFGSGGTMLHDIVRDQRGPQHPATLSEGSAEEWARFFVLLAQDRLGDAEVSARLRGWLAHGTDHSMVASAFVLDPLSHGTRQRPALALWNKTGTDDGVRADVGLVRGPAGELVYAAICNGMSGDGQTEAVLVAMRAIGEIVRELAMRGETPG